MRSSERRREGRHRRAPLPRYRRDRSRQQRAIDGLWAACIVGVSVGATDDFDNGSPSTRTFLSPRPRRWCHARSPAVDSEAWRHGHGGSTLRGPGRLETEAPRFSIRRAVRRIANTGVTVAVQNGFTTKRIRIAMRSTSCQPTRCGTWTLGDVVCCQPLLRVSPVRSPTWNPNNARRPTSPRQQGRRQRALGDHPQHRRLHRYGQHLHVPRRGSAIRLLCAREVFSELSLRRRHALRKQRHGTHPHPRRQAHPGEQGHQRRALGHQQERRVRHPHGQRVRRRKLRPRSCSATRSVAIATAVRDRAPARPTSAKRNGPSSRRCRSRAASETRCGGRRTDARLIGPMAPHPRTQPREQCAAARARPAL